MLCIRRFCFVMSLMIVVSAAQLTDLEHALNCFIDVYHNYSNTISNLIDPQGIEKLCSDLDVSRTDIRFLMLAWTMKAEKQGYITHEEWTRGLKALRADTIDELKKALPQLEKEVRTPSNFADFYAYACRYSLTEERQESIDIETICQLLGIVLGSTFRPQVNYFVEYLKIQNDYKVINMDQWMGFYRFCNEISFPEMTEYNPGLAWPCFSTIFGHSSPRQLDGAGQTDVGFNHIFHHGSVSSRAVDEQDLEGIVDVFHRYSNTASNLIDPEGIELLCSDLDVSRTDIRFLMLAWKMKAEKQGYFTQEEWTRGLVALGVVTLDKLKKALPELEKEVRKQSNFADFYAYAFTYSLTEEEQKSIDIETISQLLDTVMGSTFRPQVDSFVDYLKQIQNDYKVINMDQWMGFYRFCNEVRRPSNFADFYAYAFTYSLTEEEQKSVDIETICQLLDIVMGSTFRPQVDYFLDYLKIQNDYKVIYMDQWMGFYRFCNEISFPDMSEYNPGLAWPLLLNNFVEWIREKQA
uniref:Defective in cullin neddylation protein n=1 Tax=Brassica campestris TaxID=3711 RepID=M4DJH1_BRACM